MGGPIKLSFSKSERLKNLKQIDLLFSKPRIIKAYPLIFSYLVSETAGIQPIQALFSAPKRNFKRAVDRNRVKRVLRDRFRLVKQEFIHPGGLKGDLRMAFIYTSKDLPDYKAIDKSLLKIIQKLKDEADSN